MQDITIKYKALPRAIKLDLAVREASVFQGQFKIQDFSRLADLLMDPQDTMTATLACKKDPQGLVVLECWLHGVVHMICQRCMQTCPVQLDVKTLLSPVGDEDAALELASDYEPVIASNGYVDVGTLVEDEILLSLPITPMHENKDCNK